MERASRKTLAKVLLLLALVLSSCGESRVGPVIEALLPARGAPGLSVDLVGERFEGAVCSVSFGGKEARVLDWQARRIRVTVPELGAGVTVVAVVVDGMVSNSLSFYLEGSVKLDGRP